MGSFDTDRDRGFGGRYPDIPVLAPTECRSATIKNNHNSYSPHSHGDHQIHILQRQVGNAAVNALLQNSTHTETTQRRGALLVQRNSSAENALTGIQGSAMFALLPQLAQLPAEIRNDEAVGYQVGGPRLVTAMRVIKARGTPWLNFVDTHNDDLSKLPVDQIHDIMTFLGAPKESRYYKAGEFDGKFDGLVDPVGGIITVFLRVKIDVIGAQFGAARPGTPGWQEETQEGRQKFVKDFERIVEEQWSQQGTVKPACPVGSVAAFKTQLRVQIVEENPHATFTILPNPTGEGRSNMGSDGQGALTVDANEVKTETTQVCDLSGKHPEEVTNTRVATAHEVGHALGLDHVRGKGNEDRNYGITADERRDMMGAGHALQVIIRQGKIFHDDFLPFERVGERWGRDVFPGALASRCNRWSASAGGG